MGIVPVWLDLKFTMSAEFTASANVEATLTGGARQNLDFGFTGRYVRGASPAVTWTREVDAPPVEIVPFSYTINGSANAEVRLVPQIDLRVNSLAGVTANANPRFGFTGEATVTNGELESAEWNMYARADLSLGLSVLGLDDSSVPSTSWNLYSRNWVEVYPEELQIKKHPQSVGVEEGASVMLEVMAAGPGGEWNLKYQWYHNDLPLPGRTKSILSLVNVNHHKTGSYYVKVSAKGESLDSGIAVVALVAEGFALIPGGSISDGGFI